MPVNESSVGISSDETVMLEGESEAMRGGAGQSGCGDKL